MVIAIIGILASLAIAAYQTYTVRAQVAEGLNFAMAVKVPIVDAFRNDGIPPAGRLEAGMSANATDTSSTYVTRVDIVNGRIDITYGNGAHPEIQGDSLSLTPYIADGEAVTWRCGNAAAPAGVPLTGASHLPPTVDPRYLPSSCR